MHLHPQVSIIIANYNTKGLLANCLRSIRCITNVPHEVIVVDDASTDGSVDMVRVLYPYARLRTNVTNVGFVQAINGGYRMARGRYIMLLNSDTALINDAVWEMANFLEVNNDVGVCGADLYDDNLRQQVSYGHEPSLRQSLSDALFLNDLFPKAGFPSIGVIPNPRTLLPLEVEYVSGAALMIRSRIIGQLLFDPAFEADCEDIELCKTVRDKWGLKVYFLPKALVWHKGGSSYGLASRRRIRMRCRSYNTFLSKHHGRTYTRIVRTLLAWHHAVKLIARLGTGRWEEAKSAWYYVVYNIIGQ